MRWRAAALAASVMTVALVLAGAVLAAIEPSATTIALAAVGGAAALAWAGLGVPVARRNRVGALLGLVGLTLAMTVTREVGWRVLAERPRALASLDWLVAVLAESSIWLFVALALLLLRFPDGRLPGARWRAVPALLVAGGLAHQAYGAFAEVPFRPPLEHLARPFGPPPFALELVGSVADPLLAVLMIACAAAPFVRYRRAGEPERGQLRWLALAGIGVPGFLAACLFEIAAFGDPAWGSVAIGVVTIFALPAAIAVAMLRHDLYDVDRVLATTVAYAVMSAVLIAIFAAVSFAAGALLGQDSTLAAAAATAVTAVALSPLRRRLQRPIDRRLYPQRAAAIEAIEQLQRDIHAGAAEPEQLAPRLREALRDPSLRLGYRLPGAGGFVDEAGAAVAADGSVPVMTGDEVIGALRADSLSGELLRQVASESATLVEVVRLRLQVTTALREVEASRARLLQVGYEERRRLERDLHDGAQQRLVSLGMTLRLAQRHLDDPASDMHGLIDQSVAELATAVAELRTIAHGLRPSSLDDGLQAAITALTQHLPVPVRLDIAPGRLPDDVATTAYYVTSEAIANAVKHAGASRIDVRIARSNGHLEVRVSDDGTGGACIAAGSGLAGLSDRVSALGGALALDSAGGRGTVVEAVVPCAS